MDKEKNNVETVKNEPPTLCFFACPEVYPTLFGNDVH